MQNGGTGTQNPQAKGDAPTWLAALRAYFCAVPAGNLIWETLHLPLYTIWKTGTLKEQAFAVIHCTLGDLLIAVSTLTLALVVVGNNDWPQRRFWPVAILTIVLGVGYTIFSEWQNVVVRASWAYSDWMPVITLFGLRIGLSPLLQWIAVPAAAFAMAKRVAGKRTMQPG